MSAKDLERSLREGGEKVSQGRIRIDSARALQRLRDFRFAEPAHWVLEVLRAAALSGAQSVSVRTDADDVEVFFDGQPFPPDAMRHLLEQALNPGKTDDEKRTRLLALGAAGALGVGARFVKLHSGGVALTLADERVELEEQPGPGTRLHLRKAFGWRVTAAFFRGSPEGLAVTQRAHRFPVPLSLNGKSVIARGPSHAVTRVVAGEGWTLEVVLPDGPPLRRSTLELDVAGVVVAQRSLLLPGLQLQAWLRADGLRRNASGSDVVDGDKTLEEASKALRKVSRELLGELGVGLASDDLWRHAFVRQLLEEDTLDDAAKKLLQQVPLVPGPAGEWLTLAELTEAMREDSRLFIAKRPWPKGSYPTPTVLVTAFLDAAKLLPVGRRVDVEEMVKQKERVAFNRERLEAMPVEPPDLPSRGWVARARLEGTGITGEVGFEASGNGAFVRVLHRGRLMEAGELTSLAPLRLRAVIDWTRPLGDTFFEEGGSNKLLGLVLKHVEEAATKALCEALPRPEVLPHAFDLLSRLVGNRKLGPKQLPPALLAAPLFPCLGGDEDTRGAVSVSLATLLEEPRWSFVTSRFPHGMAAVAWSPLLDGSRVLVLSPAQHDVLEKLGSKRLEDVTAQLTHEQEVRRRLAGPKQAPEVKDVVAKVRVEGEGLRGEVGVARGASRGAGARLDLTLLKDGFELETTELSARYHHAVASVDCAALSPNARWAAATRDGAFHRVSAAVHDAQRRLAAALVQVPRTEWPLGGDLFLLAFLKKELVGFDPAALDDVTRAVAQAPLFEAARGRRSLLELRAQVKRDGHLFVLSPHHRPEVPADFEVLFELPAMAVALGEALGRPPQDAIEALARLEARRRLESLPLVDFALPPGLALKCLVTEAQAMALVGLREDVGGRASVQVLIGRRAYALVLVPCALSLTVLLDAPLFEPVTSRELTEGQAKEVTELVDRLVQAVLRRALQLKDDPAGRRALLLALGQSVDLKLPKVDADALQTRELFLCTDGRRRSFRELDGEVQFVIAVMEGVLPNRRPIVVANDPATRFALQRWPRAEKVEDSLRLQQAAVRQREAVAPVTEIVSSVASPWRLRLDQGLSGEVVVASAGEGRLELFIDRKPLCVVEGALPPPLAGAIDSPRLTPKPGFKGVVHDGHLKEAIDVLKSAGERLAMQVAKAPRDAAWEGPLVRLAFWVGAARAWEWKGKKKARGKKKKETAQASGHPLLAVPLLRASDGSTLSVQALIELQRAESQVDVTKQGGAFLEPARRAWWPRPGEEALAVPLGLVLNDVTADVQFAESIRQRPRFEVVRAPLEGPWREPVRGPSLEGEVALGEAPDGTLIIEVLHERMLLERWSSPHPVGGVARVDSRALTPDERWTSAKRDASFKALVAATEAALERLLLRRLAVNPLEEWTAGSGRQGGTFSAWAAAAVRWRAGQGGPLARLVPELALFCDVKRQPVTVGAVMDLASRQGRVPLAGALGPDEAVEMLVLLDSKETRDLLSTLRLNFDDVSAELRRARELQQTLTARRLASLTWKGDALVKVSVAAGPLTGELALTTSASTVPGAVEGVLLARDGVSIHPMEDAWPGVVGVIDVKDLVVDGAWTTATPTRAQRSLIRVQVERLFAALAEVAPSLGAREREVAATWALRFLSDGGVEAPAHLDRLTGAAHALADAPLFITVEGEKVSLRAVGAQVNAQDRVAVLPSSAGVPGGTVSCVLATSAWGAPWLSALEDLFGKTKVWRVMDLDAWQLAVRESEPPEGAAELHGLRMLRREVRLLRAGALGRLTPDDLEDVRLSRAGGGTALRYDRKRKLALLDPDHPDIARALKEAKQRPERIWVLIAALFGLVNRELDQVTDGHEAQLLLALAGHLATNPKLLG